LDLTGGGSADFGPSYFTLGLDGLSWDGSPIPIGGTNPLPTLAVLTGTFSPTTINVSGIGTQTIEGTFSATISPSSGSTLSDGDFAVINATPSSGGGGGGEVPEPSTWLLVSGGITAAAVFRKRRFRGGPACALLAGFLALSQFSPAANAAVTLASATSPSGGVAGINTVNVTGSGFPAGTITPAKITVSFSSSCFGTVAATTTASSIVTILGSTKRVGFLLPGSLAQATYSVWLTDSGAGGDAAFTSSNCSRVQVTHTNPTLSACLPTSSLGVLVPTNPGAVRAYVPNGAWGASTTGIQVVPIEGSGSPASVSTPNAVNSCSSNPATGQTVCVANNTDVYLLTGSTLNRTLTSGSNSNASFSGGSCRNCGVAINALTNKAVINMGLSPSPSNSGIQMLNLSTNTFEAPIPSNQQVSENISVDPTRNLILSPNEFNFYNLYQIQSNGSSVIEFNHAVTTGGEMDSAAEDCSTGIALSSLEFTNDLYITDLTQATFNTGTHTWTAPQQVVTLSTTPYGGFAAGTSGISVAPGSAHQAIVTGEFGGNVFAALQLPSTSGSGVPAIVDYAVGIIPGFSSGLDPHTITAYTSPNNGKAYGLLANSPPPSQLARVDLQCVLSAPRQAGTHGVDPSYDLVAHGCITFIATH